MGKWLSPNRAGNAILWVVGLAVGIGGWFNQSVAVILLSIAFLWTIASLLYWLKKHRNETHELEITIKPSKYIDGSTINGNEIVNPFYSVQPGQGIRAIFGLVILNHSVERKEYIVSASITLRKRRWLVGSKTLLSLPLEIQGYPNDRPFKDIEIEPQSKTEELFFNFCKDIPAIVPFPQRSKLVLVMEMIGPNPRIERVLEVFRHDPKQVPDIPVWKT